MRQRLIFFSLALLVTPAVAIAEGSDEIVAVVRKTLDSALEVARGGGTQDEQLDKLRAIAHDFLDTRAMGRRAIGSALEAQPADRQEQYFDLFGQVIVRAYLQKLLLFHSPHFNYGEPVTHEKIVVVKTQIVTSKDEFHVDYPMRQHDGRWLAIDVVVEGISLTENYRAQFASLLRDHSFEELLDQMRRAARVAEKPA